MFLKMLYITTVSTKVREERFGQFSATACRNARILLLVLRRGSDDRIHHEDEAETLDYMRRYHTDDVLFLPKSKL